MQINQRVIGVFFSIKPNNLYKNKMSNLCSGFQADECLFPDYCGCDRSNKINFCIIGSRKS